MRSAKRDKRARRRRGGLNRNRRDNDATETCTRAARREAQLQGLAPGGGAPLPYEQPRPRSGRATRRASRLRRARPRPPPPGGGPPERARGGATLNGRDAGRAGGRTPPPPPPTPRSAPPAPPPP